MTNTGFSPKSARTTAPNAFGNSSIAQTAAIHQVPTVVTTALAKLDNSELAQVRKMKDQLIKVDPAALVSYGANVQDAIASMADEVLKHTKGSDMEFVGTKLTSIIIAAKGINTNSLNEKSNLPLIGGLINKLRNSKERVVGQFDLVSTQVEKIVDEVDKFNAGVGTRLKVMEQLYVVNMQQYHELGMLVMGAHMAIEELQVQTDAFAAQLGDTPDPFDIQQVNDAKNYLVSLEMKASNFERLKMTSLQQAIAVRMMQQNGIQLIEQFALVKSQVVPQWKRQFMVALMVDEQRRGVALNTMITDATNDMAKQTATMLKQTSIDVARANQRGVLDLSTIEHVQSELISGIQEVFKITEEGSTQRKLVSQRVGELQKELQTKLTTRK